MPFPGETDRGVSKGAKGANFHAVQNAEDNRKGDPYPNRQVERIRPDDYDRATVAVGPGGG